MNEMYFDTEFIEDGKTIELLSIGVASWDGRVYYAEPAETDRTLAGDWVKEHVLPHLTGPVKPRAEIAEDLRRFAGGSPEWWAYYADYDWVALCQLYGRMIDLPSGWPKFCRDLRQRLDDMGLGHVHQPDDMAHNAMSDACWVADTHRSRVP